MDEYISFEEAAATLGVAKRTISHYVRVGKLTGYRTGIGNKTIVKRADVEALKVPRPKEAAS